MDEIKYQITIFMGEEVIGYMQNGRTYCIPKDEANTDYQRYLEWVAAGNSPEPWEG